VKHEGEGFKGVSRETTERLAIYADLLLRWNRTINLMSRRDEPAIWTRHIADSLALCAELPPRSGLAIDLGSGAGLPGLVLAIATGRHFDLVEADQRKCAFLREAARATAAPVTVHTTRIDALALPPAALITARALAALPQLLAWSAPRLAPSGVCLFPKGRTVDAELTQAARQWHMTVVRVASPTDADATLLRISEISRVRDVS
jgi:16S rRNA (guanine527-N7)-methyltransferase